MRLAESEIGIHCKPEATVAADEVIAPVLIKEARLEKLEVSLKLFWQRSECGFESRFEWLTVQLEGRQEMSVFAADGTGLKFTLQHGLSDAFFERAVPADAVLDAM